MCTTSKTIFVFGFFFTSLSSQVFPQGKISSVLIQQDTSLSRPDSLGLIQGRVVQVSPPSEKSTTLAILLSAVLPGAGQIYTERYLHAPVVWWLGYYLVRQWNKADNLYIQYSDRYSESVALDTLGKVGNSNLKFIRDFYHDERDRMGLYIAIAYILNIVDAYVGASLYNFDVSDQLGGSAALRLRIQLR